MIWIFYFLSLVAVWLGVVSLHGGVRYRRFVREKLDAERDAASEDNGEIFAPFATVFVPFRGIDQNFARNIRALFVQDYPAYEILFVTDAPTDAGASVIETMRSEATADAHQNRVERTELIIAGAATDTGQKVHNLRAAVGEAAPESKVFVFVDTDAEPHATWLAQLVQPLADESVGATTGYRWFIPRGGRTSEQRLKGNAQSLLATHLRAVWNASIASALGANVARNFCWGGSTAIRRETFERLEMCEKWRGTLSDDFTLTNELQRASLPICFVPQCLVASFENCTWRELLEFTTRQVKITRVYAAHLWKIILVGNGLFTFVFFGNVCLALWLVAVGAHVASLVVPLIFATIIFALGASKSYLRLLAVREVFRARETNPASAVFSMTTTLAHVCLWCAASALYFYNALAAARSRVIVWRGIRYELKSRGETAIIKQ